MHDYKLIRTFAFAGLALAVAPGCGDDGGDPAVDAAPPAVDAAPAPDAPGNDGEVTIERSILINDEETLAAGDFGLRRTVQAILDSSEGAASTPEDFIASLLATFNDDSRVNPDSTLTVPVDVRPGEAGLSPSELLDPANAKGLRVVGIFNRFERMPMMGEFCGSARLVYVMPTDDANGSTITLMFDAAVPNPDMAQGREGCRVVADFWAGLSDIDDPAERAAALETFFYVGTADLPAVVKFANLQGNGAITTDHFINGVKWQMRSFNTGLNDGMVPIARPVRVNAPITELFDSDFDPAAAGPAWAETDPAVFATQRAAFQQDFIAMQVARLIAPEKSGNALTNQSIVLGFGVGFGLPYRDFQSDSDETDDAAVHADEAFRTAITAELEGTDLTAEIVLNRANALTCGGCHYSAIGDQVGVDSNGNPVTWPEAAPGGFVHINEKGEISELLEVYWLPDRLAKLNTYLGAAPALVAAAGPSCTLDEVKAAKTALLQSQPGRARVAAREAYDRAVDQARACDAAQPGALTSVRDQH